MATLTFSASPHLWEEFAGFNASLQCINQDDAVRLYNLAIWEQSEMVLRSIYPLTHANCLQLLNQVVVSSDAESALSI